MTHSMLNANQRGEVSSIVEDELRSLKARNQELEQQVKDLAWQIRNTANTTINPRSATGHLKLDQVENANELLRADIRGLHSRIARLEGQMHHMQAGQEHA